MDPHLIRAIVERASTQLDLITVHQLDEIDVDKHRRRQLRAAGVLIPLGRHTYGLVGAVDSFDRRVLTACLDTGGVASHRTAAQLHGLHQDLEHPLIEVCIVEGRAHRATEGWVVHSSTNLPDDDIVMVGPIPCAGIARTFLMLAALVPVEVSFDTLRTAVGDAVRDGRASDAWLWWRLERLRCRGRNGVSTMEALLVLRQHLGRTESWLEHTFVDLVVGAGLPRPVVQARIRQRGAFVARVDTLFPGRLIVELEGYQPHRDQRHKDEVRRRKLTFAGCEVLVVTYDELVQDPDGVLTDLATALARRAA